MIELLYFASQIQCGVGGEFLDIQVDVYQNQELVETMVVDDRILLPVNSINDLTLEYSVINNTTECHNLATPSELILAPNDELPNLSGFDQQDSVVTLLSNLNQFQELFLVELGTEDITSSAYDLQDVTLILDKNPLNYFAD